MLSSTIKQVLFPHCIVTTAPLFVASRFKPVNKRSDTLLNQTIYSLSKRERWSSHLEKQVKGQFILRRKNLMYILVMNIRLRNKPLKQIVL